MMLKEILSSSMQIRGRKVQGKRLRYNSKSIVAPFLNALYLLISIVFSPHLQLSLDVARTIETLRNNRNC